MSILQLFRFIVFMAMPSYIFGADDLSYVDGSSPFLLIEDVNRQADAWGTCSATYEVMAMLLADSDPAQAKQYSDFKNGASLAVVMTHVSDGLSTDMSPNKFNSLWNFSKLLGDSIPETKRTMILADAESLTEADTKKFIDKIGATLKVCTDNLDGQQAHIDIWRALAKSGLLEDKE